MYILPRIKKAAACCLAVLITLGIVGSSKYDYMATTSATESSAYYEKRLDDIAAEQKELDKKISDADNSINGQIEKLDAVNEKISNIKEKIETVQDYVTELEDEMVILDDEMRKTQVSLSEQEENIKTGVNDFMDRIRAMYVAGSGSYTDVLVNSVDFYDVLMRLELLKRVANHDNDTINGLIEQKNEIEKTKTELEDKSKKLKEKTKAYSKQQKSLLDEQTQLLNLQLEYDDNITKLQNDKQGLQQQSKQLADEYGKVSGQAQTSKTGKKTTTTAGSNSSKPAKTTKKTTKKDVATTTTSTAITTKPYETTERPTTTTSKPITVPTQTTTTGGGNGGGGINETKIDIVVNYAKSMVGGRYVWGGSQFGATDCSGLVMLSYAQIGISLPHYAASQANYGVAVNYNNMQPGDLIFFGGSSISSIYHVAIYIGNGRMVHAENTNTGIVISNVNSFSYYNSITCIRRLIF